MSMSIHVLSLVRKVVDEGGVSHVAGWKIHGSTTSAAFRRGLLQEVAPDVWGVTPEGARIARVGARGQTPIKPTV